MSVIKGRIYDYQPAGWERFDPKSPYGCPKQGTMGHYFLETPDTGVFIGLVSAASLQPEKVTA
jgi:hypothetical protein